VWVLLTLAVVSLLLGGAVLVNALGGGDDPVRVRVPSLANLTQAEAEAQITAAKLVVGDVTRRADAVAEGRVISSNPAGGTSVDERTRVDLVISQGPQETRVPTLAGLSLTDARAQLLDADLQVGDIQYVDSDENRNQVLEADPEEGSTQPAGTAVNLTVASGNQQVPDVRGATESEARATLENAGFGVEVEERETADADPGTVVAQTPEAEASQRLDSVVTIFVAVAPPVETPEPQPTQTAPATPPPATTPAAEPTPTPQVEDEEDEG
jgi:serine/threonine-protein kinase